MRILVAHPGPNFSVHDVFVGWTEALRELGQQVAEFNFADRLTFYDSALVEVEKNADGQIKVRKALAGEQAIELAVNGLYAALYKTHPDVLLCVSGFLLPTDLLDLARAYGTKVVMLHTESPYEDGRQLDVAGHADLNLINDPTNLDQFQAVAPTVYVPHSYRPTLHSTGKAIPRLAADFAFVGTGYPSRISFLEAMDFDGLDVLLGGNWQRLEDESPLQKYLGHDTAECMDNTETVGVYRSAKVGMNLYRREADEDHLLNGWACGPREIEMAACGLFYLRDPRPEGDELLPMLPTFDSPEDASEKVRYWLARPNQRAELALRARRAVADRTFNHRAAELLALLDTK